MSRFTTSIIIRRPIEDVFEVLTNVENTGRWFPGNVEEHWTSPPPRGVGATRHATIRMYGRVTENDAIVTEYDPPNRAVMRVAIPSATADVALDFAGVDAGTRVMTTFNMALRGAMRLTGPPFAWWYRGRWTKGLENLQRMMEAGEL